MAYADATPAEVRTLIAKAHKVSKTVEALFEGHSATPDAANAAEIVVIEDVIAELEDALVPFAVDEDPEEPEDPEVPEEE